MLPFKSMKINFGVSRNKMRFLSEGDWTDDGKGNYEVWVIKLPFIFMLAVLFHELIEIGWGWDRDVR